MKHKQLNALKYFDLSVSTGQLYDAMLRHSTLFKSTLPPSIRPAGLPTSPRNLAGAPRKRAVVIPFGKKSPEEAMEAPVSAGTSNGAGAPTKESGDGADSGLVRTDSIPISKRADGLGGFDVSSSPMRQISLCYMFI
jgi:hypothetical protein